MTNIFKRARGGLVAVAALLAVSGASLAAEVDVMASGGLTAAYKELVPGFEKASGHSVKSAYGASQGGATDSIPSRLDRGEPGDVVIMASDAMDKLIAAGKVVPGSRVDLARSPIGLSVAKGTPKPDISTTEALKKTLLDAKSIAYSASASGTYLSETLFPRLGVWEAIEPKAKRVVSERVGTVVARGDAELGFQQVSELLPIEGLDFVGTLPDDVQKVTIFSAGLVQGAKDAEAGKELITYLASREAAPAIAKSGMEPIAE
ncbi:substrate-binding domain-containing protein [Aureimonas psammosilenae]|uniref:substrate-binding domain-containing protein n=1 Tax=Aureimonas psammosilenae TaxID=2495496 RepID=UPI001AEE3C01|nr:substrate-binding domain-containing protein [Aureimonas psammosilenae]